MTTAKRNFLFLNIGHLLDHFFMLIFTTPTYMVLDLLKDHLIARGSCSYASAIFFMVGEFLFLLPPVPGPAVYVVARWCCPTRTFVVRSSARA